MFRQGLARSISGGRRDVQDDAYVHFRAMICRCQR
jgi:hypothetical protein